MDATVLPVSIGNPASCVFPKGYSFMLKCLLSLALIASLSGVCLADEPVKPAAPVPLNPEQTVLLDKPGNRLLLKTTVCLREGLLEMLVCPKQTKEHESILSFNGKAQVVHAGLLALGLKPGHPARFGEKFELPEGPELQLFVNWTDAENQPHRRSAQEWIRHVTHRYFDAQLDTVPSGVPIDQGEQTLRYDANSKELLWYGPMTAKQRDILLSHSNDEAYQIAVKKLYSNSQPKELKADWIFAGSGFSTLESGESWYQAEAGSLICVANFGDATIDISVQSSASGNDLLFEPYTERIPPAGTPVTLELIPVSKPESARN